MSAREPFDVLVIGGGITGVGVALDAASRGLRTALVERDDFASGTSSKSSKLVHGGLRYLQNGDVRLVYEALRERQRLMRNAPHLVSVLPFLIPMLTKDGVVSKKLAKALGSAMWMYDLTGGCPHRQAAPPLSAEAASPLAHAHRDRLSPGTSTTTPRPTTPGSRSRSPAPPPSTARCRQPVPVVELTSDADGTGRRRRRRGPPPTASGSPCAAAAWSTPPACGPTRSAPSTRDPTPTRSGRPRGPRHVPWELVRNDIAVIIPVPKDKRSLFLVPWGPLPDGTFRALLRRHHRHRHDGRSTTRSAPTRRHRLRAAALNHSITPPRPITRDDVTGVWAGCAPLVKAAPSGRTADLSRRHQVAVSERPRRHGDRRQAHHLPRDGRGHRRRGRRRRPRPSVGADGRAPRRLPCSGADGRAPRRRRPRRTSPQSDGTAPRPCPRGQGR
jgi:glycerol-3-phosphate dehydrogenase